MLDELVRLVDVGDLHGLAVPHQALSGEPEREVPEQYGLGERSGVVEVRHGLAVGLDRLEPVAIVIITGRPADVLRSIRRRQDLELAGIERLPRRLLLRLKRNCTRWRMSSKLWPE